MSSRPFPPDVQTDVAVKSRRRCALCYGLKGDLAEKQGQLAHIDRNPENSTLENAAFLCFVHHNEYDSTPSQAKGLMPGELKIYREDLYQIMDKPGPWQTTRRRESGNKKQPIDVSLDVYDRRVPTYRRTVEFLRMVVSNLRPEMKDILQFASDTDEALFLFDDGLADYLEDMFKRALRLHTVNLLRSGKDALENFEKLKKEQMDLWLWFTSQYEEIRFRFSPFLRLGKYAGTKKK